MKTTPMMTSWGCPFKCNFCSVTAMFGRKYRFRSADSIIAELKELQPRKIFFYDDNIAADKKRLKELLQRMLDEDLVVPWSAQMRTDVVRDPELLDLMHRTGCFRAYLGLESVNQATLDAFDKHQSVDDIVQAIRILHENGIESHGMFVLGADTDTIQSVRDTVKFAMKNHIDTIQLAALTPLPGTPLYYELDAAGRIFDKRWYLFDAQHVVFEPKNMTAYELQREAAARLHEVLLAAPVGQVLLHVPLHQAALPELGLVDRAHVAQEQGQPGLHEVPSEAAAPARPAGHRQLRALTAAARRLSPSAGADLRRQALTASARRLSAPVSRAVHRGAAANGGRRQPASATSW